MHSITTTWLRSLIDIGIDTHDAYDDNDDDDDDMNWSTTMLGLWWLHCQQYIWCEIILTVWVIIHLLLLLLMMMMMILPLEIIYMVLQSGRIITYTRDKTLWPDDDDDDGAENCQFFYCRVRFMIYTHNTATDDDDNDDTYRMNKKIAPPPWLCLPFKNAWRFLHKISRSY